MTKKKRAELIAKIRLHLKELGYTEDRYGNYVKKAVPNGSPEYRVKFQTTTLRKERSWMSSDGKRWVKIFCYYYKQLGFHEGRFQATGQSL